MSPSFARGVTANGNRPWRLYREMGQQLRSPQPAFALHLSVQTLIVLDGSGTSWSSDITAEAFGTRMRAFRSLETSGAGRARIVGEQSAQHQASPSRNAPQAPSIPERRHGRGAAHGEVSSFMRP